jgi:hypothetical protein
MAARDAVSGRSRFHLARACDEAGGFSSENWFSATISVLTRRSTAIPPFCG